MILVDGDKLTMSRPGRPLFSNLSVTIASGDRLGIVGLNGCGKSTLVRVLIGEAEPEEGVVRRGRGVRLATLTQNPRLTPGTVRDAVGQGWEGEAVLDRLGMGDRLDADVSTLSGGEEKRVALARTLVAEADLLVLDEPTNHLDIDGIAWLEDRLAGFPGGLLLVTHDRHLLDAVTTRVLEIDRGNGYIHEGGYDAYLEGRAAREEAAGVAEAVRANLARRELAWLRRGAPARTRKSKSRIARANALLADGPQAAARSGELNLHVDTPRLGDQVVELKGVTAGRPGKPAIVTNVKLSIGPEERLGIVGVNGSGKSTLLDTIAGRIEPAEGTVVRGPTVQLGYYDQTGRELDPKQRVRDAMVDGDGDPDWRVGKLLESFWFDSDTQFAPIELLSGGERRRLQLVMTLADKPNVLLLDEPTNDLDLDTLRVLEDFLEDFPGAVIVVSHDRAFLERTVDDVVVLDGSGRVGRIPGGYAAWEDERRAARGRKRSSAGAKPALPATSAPAEPAADAPSASTLRFRMKDLEKAMRPLQKRRDVLVAELDAKRDDHAALVELGAEFDRVGAELDRLEEEWLEAGAALEDRF